MKMLSCGLVWGVLIILLGISIILKSVFGISIPFFRILLGLFIIYIGIRIISGGWGKAWDFKDEDTIIFGSSKLSYHEGKHEYSIIFGSGTIDLRNIPVQNLTRQIEANIIFGEGDIIIPKDRPVKVELSAALGKSSMEDKSISGIGTTIWYSPEYKPDEDYIHLKTSAVFGNARVRRQNK